MSNQSLFRHYRFPKPLFLSAVFLVAPNLNAAESQIELVLQPGARLEATTTSSRIAVIAGNELKRRYEWNKCSLDASMSARKQRWYGSLGMYDPAGRLFVNPLAGCDGISRPVVEEGQIHFADESAANAWIARYSKGPSLNTVWTDDGLLIQWGVNPQRHQINVDLWQICIHGNRPTKLAGARKMAVQVIHPNGPQSARRECATVPESVVEETQKAWTDFWRQIDE